MYLIEGRVEAGQLAAGALMLQRAAQHQQPRLRHGRSHPPVRHISAAHHAIHQAAGTAIRAGHHALHLQHPRSNQRQHAWGMIARMNVGTAGEAKQPGVHCSEGRQGADLDIVAGVLDARRRHC